MLKVFRDNLKKLAWILWLVIGVFVLLVFVDFGGAGYQGPGGGNAAASVGETAISFEEFRRQYQGIKGRMQDLYGDRFTPELEQQMGLAMQALDGLIGQKILVAEATKMGLETTPDELRQAILDIPGFQDDDGKFIGQADYERLLQLNRWTVAEFENEIRDELLVGKLNAVLEATTFVSATEVEEAYREQVERAKIRYLQVSPDRFRDEVEVGDEELREHFDSHLADYYVPERRSIDYLLVEPRLLRATLQIEDEELRAYYDSHEEEFTREERVRARHILLTASDESQIEAARQTLEDLRRRIEAGEDFAALAREYSQDETTRPRGGDLGLFARGRYNPALETAAFNAQKGDLVGPVESNLVTHTGLHLIEVQDVQEGGLQDFQSVEHRIRSRLLSERAQEAAEALAAKLAQRLEEQGDADDETLAALAEQEAGATFANAPFFSREDNVPNIGRGTPFTAESFELEPGEFSEPVQLPSGWAILRLSEIQESRVPELAEVEQEVREAVIQEKQTDVAHQALREMLQAEGRSPTLEELAAQLDVEVNESSEFGRQALIPELGFAPQITEEAFKVERGTITGPFGHPQGPVLFEVTERREWDPTAFEENRETVRQSLAQRRLGSLLESLVEQRRLELEVHYNRDLLDDFGVLDATEASSS